MDSETDALNFALESDGRGSPAARPTGYDSDLVRRQARHDVRVGRLDAGTRIMELGNGADRAARVFDPFLFDQYLTRFYLTSI